jgi:hypothetical protein
MNDLDLIRMIKKYKQIDLIEIDPVLYSINLLTDINIPNTLLFNYENTPNNQIDIVKSEFKTKTNNLYYGNGILGNLYDLKNCDYNWVLGYFFIKENHIILKSNIKCFLMGCANGSFINGMEYFLKNSKCITHEKKYDIEWLGMDIIKRSDDTLNKNIIYGYECNDLGIFGNLNHCKYRIENKFNKVNLIFNNITPNLKNNKTLVSASILSLSILKTDGILLTKILPPDYWCGDFLHYILLFAMIFNDVKVIRYPVEINNYCLYNYYLLCNNKKIVVHSSIIYRKLVAMLKRYDIDKLLFLQTIITNDDSKIFIKHLTEIKETLVNTTDIPIDSINKIIETFNRDHFII